MLYEYPDKALKMKHLEGWSVVIDCAFSNVQGLQTVRYITSY